MKAEQRKELETNTLADKMGHVVQRVKGSPRRTFFIYVVVAVVVLAAAFVGYRWWSGDRELTSKQWVEFYDGSGNFVDELAKEKDTNVGKAARFQRAWLVYWDFGIKLMATDKAGSMSKLLEATKMYGELAEECKGDPVFEPQALLGRAVAQESRAVQDRDHLKQAKVYYEEVVAKFDKSAEGKFARERLEILNDPAKRATLEGTYKYLQGNDVLGIPPPLNQQGMKGFHDFQPPGKKQP